MEFNGNNENCSKINAKGYFYVAKPTP